MRPAIFTATLLLAAAPALAAPNPASTYSGPLPHASTHGSSCAGIQALVARRGAAVLTFGMRHDAGLGGYVFGHGYDRVVKDQRYCLPRQATTPIWVPTRDVAQCFAGYTCSEGGERGGKYGR